MRQTFCHHSRRRLAAAFALAVMGLAPAAFGVDINVNNGSVFSGTGNVPANIIVNSGGTFSPGTTGVNSGLGTLTINGLTLNTGSILDYDGSLAGNDLTIINTNGLTLSAGVNISLFNAGTANPLNINGTYNFFQILGGAFPSDSSLQSDLTIANPSGLAVYTWGHNGNFITLTVQGFSSAFTWNFDGGGSWSEGAKWSPGIPGAAGDSLVFGSALTSGSGTITLDGNRTVGSLSFNNSAASYTIATGASGSLFLDNGSSSASITGGGGTHSIAANMVLNSSLSIATVTGSTITLAGGISGAKGVTISGPGKVLLTGANSYGDTTIVAGAWLQIGGGGMTGNLGAGAVANAGTLTFSRSDSISVGNALSGAGMIIQSGSGTVTLTGTGNTLTGSTVINAGKLALGPGSSIGTGALAVGGGSTLDLGGNPASATSLTGGGTIDNSAAIPASLTVGGTSTFSGNIVNSGGGGLTLIKSGPGTLALAGTNSYTATSILTGATLQIGIGGVSGTLGSGPVSLAGSLIINRADAVTVGNAITGSGNLTHTGSGTVTLTGANAYDQTIVAAGATLQVGAGGTAGTLGTGTVTNSGVLIFNRSDAISVGSPLTGAGTLVQSGTGTTTLSASSNTLTGATTINAGKLALGSGSSIGTGALGIATGSTLDLGGNPVSTTSFTGGGTVDSTAATPASLTVAGTSTFSGSIVNSGGGGLALIKAAPGTLTLSGANGYTATSILTGATLQIGIGGVSGTLGSGPVALAGSLVVNRSDAVTLGNAISGAGDFTHAGSGTLTFTGANSYNQTTLGSGATLQVGAGGTTGTLGTGAVFNGGVLIFNRSDAILVGNALSGAGTIIQSGTGTVTLTATVNALTGATTINAGKLAVGSGSSIGTGALTIAAGAAIDIGGNPVSTSALTGGGTVDNSAATAASLTVAGTSTFSGSIINSGGTGGGGGLTLIKSGPGTLSLTGANSYTDTSILTGATLQIGAGSTTGTLGTGNVSLGGTLIFNRSDAIILTNGLSGPGNLIQAGPGTLTLAASNSYNGTTIVSGATLRITTGSLGTGAVSLGGTLILDHAGAVSIGNPLSGAGALFHTGSGTTTLTSSANALTGATTLSAGKLVLGPGSSIGTNALAVAAGAVLDVGGNNVSTVNLSGAGTIDNSAAVPATLTINAGVFAGSLINTGGGGGGVLALTKATSGTLSLTGSANAYAGPTTISGGMLEFGGGAQHAIGIVSGSGKLLIDSGAVVTSSRVAVNTVQIDGTQIIRSNASITNRTSTVSTLTLSGSAGSWKSKLDLTNNNLIVANGANVPSQIRQAANMGIWNGSGGITSSAAQAAATSSTATSLAFASGSDYLATNSHTTFDSLPVNPTDTLIMYTLAGDANLDGTVTFADFLQLQNNFNAAGTNWVQGDWNYDGSTTFADFLILQNNYNKTLGVANLRSPVLGGAAVGVPEPGILTFFGIAGLSMLIRRRRHAINPDILSV